MGTKVYRSARQFAREHRRDLRRVLVSGAKGYVDAHFEDADQFTEEINDRLRETGDLQSSAERVKKGLKRIKGWTDPGAAAIDFGRQRNHYPGFDRMGGSARAPRGITTPAKERSIARDGAMQEKARRKFERSV